jgi:hypothetical protein
MAKWDVGVGDAFPVGEPDPENGAENDCSLRRQEWRRTKHEWRAMRHALKAQFRGPGHHHFGSRRKRGFARIFVLASIVLVPLVVLFGAHDPRAPQ